MDARLHRLDEALRRWSRTTDQAAAEDVMEILHPVIRREVKLRASPGGLSDTQADELAEICQVSAWKCLHKLAGARSPIALLRCVIKKRTATYVQHAQRQQARVFQPAPAPPVTVGGSSGVLARVAWREFLDEMEESDRTLVALRYEQDLSLRQIARSLGRSTTFVQARLARIHDRMRNRETHPNHEEP